MDTALAKVSYVSSAFALQSDVHRCKKALGQRCYFITKSAHHLIEEETVWTLPSPSSPSSLSALCSLRGLKEQVLLGVLGLPVPL